MIIAPMVATRRRAAATESDGLIAPIVVKKYGMRPAVVKRLDRARFRRMSASPTDIYTEPTDVDPDTLKNLGPLRAMAGTWEGTKGNDDHPVAPPEGTKTEPYLERIDLQPIDPQTNGPQLFYGLRYHTWICRPGEKETFHDQVGYWLWEPATNTIFHSLA